MANKLTLIADNWDSLSYAEKKALFEESSYQEPTLDELKEVFGDNPFIILTYVDDSSSETLNDYIVTGLPKPVFKPAKEMIYVGHKNNIDNVTINTTLEGNTTIKLFATIDSTTYKTFYEGEWIEVDTKNNAQLFNMGLSIEDIQNLTTDQWAALTTKFNTFDKLGFGYILDKETTNDVCAINSIVLNLIDGVDGELVKFKFIFVGYEPDGKLKFIANKNIHSNISWETLNSEELCTLSGRDMTYSKSSPTVILRLPSSALTKDSKDGEWDALIASDLDSIHGSDETYWNTESKTWTLNTPIEADDEGTAAQNTMRIVRGGDNISAKTNVVSTTANTSIGYRPVLLIDECRNEEAYIPPINLTAIKNIANSVPGNIIKCEYAVSSSGTVGRFSNLAKAAKELISDRPPATPNGSFGFIHVGYTPSGAYKFVADRNIQSNISWEALNTAGYCTLSGTDVEYLTGIKGSYIRILQSDAVNEDMDIASSEWDAIMLNSNIGGTDIASDWNILRSKSWTLNTPRMIDDVGTPADNTSRVVRGCETDDTDTRKIFDSNASYGSICFRPVLIVPMDKQSAICDIIANPTYTRNGDITIDAIITPFKDDIDITSCTARILNDSNEFVLERTNLTSTSFRTVISNSVLVKGDNVFTIIFTVDGIDNEYKITIHKEVSGDTVKVRDFKNYTGGFDLSNNMISTENTVINSSINKKINNAVESIIIPYNTIKIDLAEN